MKKLFIILIMILLSGCTNINTNENSSIYYQIFVGSFSDSNDDGIGDLKGIIQKLDYLETLNIKGIWLTPIHPSDSYHKYDVKNYYDIDPHFGTLDDFKMLIKECNKRNIDIIMDLVINHTSNKHPMFIDATNAINNKQLDNPIINNYIFTKERNDISTKLNKDFYYDSSFGGHMPDLNLNNDNVFNEIMNISKYWLDLGVKGFRLDAVIHYFKSNKTNIEFLNKYTNELKKYKEDIFIVGEAWSDNNTLLNLYNSKINSLFNFDMSGTNGKIVNSIRYNNGYELSYWLVNYQNELKHISPESNDSIFISNHDQGRSRGYLYTSKEKQFLLNNVLLLAPGNVFIYYGEEFGMLGSGIDENKRLAMPWGDNNTCNNPIKSNYKNIDTSLVKQEDDKDSIYNHYKLLSNIRLSYPTLGNSNISLLDDNVQELYGVIHNDGNKKVIVLHNFSDKYIEYELDYKIIKYNLINYKEESSIDDVISIAPYSSIVMEVE